MPLESLLRKRKILAQKRLRNRFVRKRRRVVIPTEFPGKDSWEDIEHANVEVKGVVSKNNENDTNFISSCSGNTQKFNGFSEVPQFVFNGSTSTIPGLTEEDTIKQSLSSHAIDQVSPLPSKRRKKVKRKSKTDENKVDQDRKTKISKENGNSGSFFQNLSHNSKASVKSKASSSSTKATKVESVKQKSFLDSLKPPQKLPGKAKDRPLREISFRNNGEALAFLKLEWNASNKEIKRKYLQLAKQLHPDKHAHEKDYDAHKFYMVQSAYSKLKESRGIS